MAPLCPGWPLRFERNAVLIAQTMGYVCLALVLGSCTAVLYFSRELTVGQVARTWWGPVMTIGAWLLLTVMNGYLRHGHRELARIAAEIAKLRSGWQPLLMGFKREETYGTERRACRAGPDGTCMVDDCPRPICGECPL